ncbi:MAG: ABC transporter substrate-binding protein [Candidatus Freyarchaeota archaeon]
MLTKRKTVISILALVVVVGVAGAAVWQFYRPKGEVASPISIVDDVGRNVTITNYPPERIVSLAPSCTEILFALGLGDKVVGVDEYSDYPPEVKERVKAGNLTTVGSFAEINVETVIGLEPDLILATGGVQRLVVERLEELGQTVIVLYPKGFEGVLQDISLVGKVTGKIDEARVLVADMQKRAQEIVNKTKNLYRPRVYVECFFDGGYWSFAGDSYVNELIYMAGGINVFSGFPGGHISTSTEEVVKADPEIIIISKGSMAEACGLTPEVIRNRPGWSEIYAVQNNKIHEIEESIIVRGGPRLIEGLEELAKIIHPELFS